MVKFKIYFFTTKTLRHKENYALKVLFLRKFTMMRKKIKTFVSNVLTLLMNENPFIRNFKTFVSNVLTLFMNENPFTTNVKAIANKN
ncbi:hypothetical protein CEN46_19645 [Fischerella thermalis CCMEE 5318]|uniref:Uncharacterized protein n=1 Tax=Fischerella thermalis CCMEE 5318 TaxID=2019666 RepID=A0A2N6L9K9_9CYAN|nr:hypothetical protein CEN46_19645 [Fischerella thermalis CCMEE 5318]